MDIETILEIYEDDYNPGPRPMNQGPRNMYAYGGEITQGPNAGKHKFIVGKNPEKVEYFDDYDDGKEWEKKTRTKKGYDKPKGKKIPMSELNKGAQHVYGVDYEDLETDTKGTKEKKKNKIYSKINDHYKRTGTYKFVVKTQDTAFSATDQAKIKKQFPNAEFGPKKKYGFAPTDPEYQSVFRFVERGFKNPYQGSMFQSFPKYLQQELINAFPDVKFNFERGQPTIIKKNGKNVISTKGTTFSKYGVPITHPRYNAISRYFDDPKPFRFGFDLKTAGGWTMAQMDRAAAQGNENYEPIKQKPNKPISRTNKIIGMIDKTGKKPKTYNINTIKNLPNFAEIQKYYDVANRARTPVSKYSNIVKLLPEGFDPKKILLNDLLQYLSKDKEGINRAKRAIEIHHTKGVKNQATGSFQLLRRDLNKLADTIEQQISKGNLSRSAELTAKGIRVETDGQKFGGKKLSATGDFKKIVSGVEEDLSTFKKKDFKKLAAALEKAGCGKAAGGRILFSEGTPGASLTKCGKKGVARFIDDLKKGNYSKATMNILRSGGGLVKGLTKMVFDPNMLKLRNLIGPTAMGFMGLFEAGVITDDVVRQGTPLNESLANNWLTKAFLPYTKEYAKAKNLLATGKVPSHMKKYVQDVVTFNDALMDIKGIENRKDSRLVDDSFGMIDGTSMYTKEQEQKDDAALMKKIGTLTEDVITPGSAKALEMKSLQDENEATRMAKPKSVNILGKDFQYSDGFSPIFGFDKLKDVRTPGYTGYDYIPDKQPVDLRPITYQDAKYTDVKMPVGLEQAYMNELGLKPRDSLSNYFFKDGPKKKTVYGERKQDFVEKPINILQQLTDEYNMTQRAKQASMYPGYYGANEKLSEGGIASLNVNKK